MSNVILVETEYNRVSDIMLQEVYEIELSDLTVTVSYSNDLIPKFMPQRGPSAQKVAYFCAPFYEENPDYDTNKQVDLFHTYQELLTCDRTMYRKHKIHRAIQDQIRCII